MSSIDSLLALPLPLRAWIESVTRRKVVSASRHLAGASREAWSVDVEVAPADGADNEDDAGAGAGAGEPDVTSAEPSRLFLLHDRGSSGGSARDAAVLRALRGSAVPVPQVVGLDETNGTLLLERIEGRSDFPAVDHESERDPTARHLMELTGRLHAIEPQTLHIPHLKIPASLADSAHEPLVRARGAAAALGAEIEPFFLFALGWLERNVPASDARCALIHSDMGPGNFLFEGGRVMAIVDWEVAHFGDPMEDLAAIAVRDMATPIGHLPTRFAEYQASSGIDVDLERVGYYRALVLVRNSLMIGLGLAHPPEGFDVVEMTMYQTLLIRAAALVICDCLGVERPEIDVVDAPVDADANGDAAADANSEVAADSRLAPLINAAQRDLETIVTPELPAGLAAHRADGAARILATLAHESRVGSALDRAELDEITFMLGERPTNRTQADNRLRIVFEAPDENAGEHDVRWARYFARRLLRLSERRRPLMASLMDRLPQSLENR